ncbi:hypothetical protein PRIPAC_88804 [Pristionchus pacificus]|uniref:Protein kinase domain-containing protein n=1 Tax=Pristionchus pacificus TaxID=54126 RepID=A0A2A6B722_PRIPA|nr:hypothetical protein PRIPAC_88804 [Pristionchus pacificus]|eukprot:PDM61664.1 protein kinase [Pristionchus pacificus]
MMSLSLAVGVDCEPSAAEIARVETKGRSVVARPMIVSTSSLLPPPHHRVVGGLDERRASSRCSLEVLGDAVVSSTAAASAKMTSSSAHQPPSSHHTIPPLSLCASTSTSTEETEEFDEEEAELSSPASSGYGRSTTSESEDLRAAAVRFRAANKSGRRQAGGADQREGGGGEEWSIASMPRHPFLKAIGRLLPLDDIEELGSLGEGFFSVVDKVRIRSTGEILVRKVAKPGVRGERRETHADVAREAKMLRRLEHENPNGISISSSTTMPLPWRARFSYAADIARGMAHIHSKRVIHRDLTSMNVLIQYSPGFPACGRAVIADFGLSCEFPREGEKLSQAVCERVEQEPAQLKKVDFLKLSDLGFLRVLMTVGTTYFMSPECLKEQHYDEKSDVFSFGIIACQLIARIDADPEIGLHRTADFGLNYRLFISYCPTDTRMELLQVAFGCCLMDPSFRLSFPEILSQLERVLTAMNKQAQVAVYPSDLSPGRLERSRSDAALRRPRAIHQRKYSAYHRPSVKPVTEGLAEEAAAMDAEYLDRMPTEGDAAGAAGEGTRPMQLQGTPLSSIHGRRTLPSPLNPFSTHARFRSARKILPSREEERDRRQSERQREGEEEEGVDECDGVRRRRTGRLMRRCSSLPSEMDSPHSLDWSDDEGGWRESEEEEEEMGDDEVYYDKSSLPGGSSGSPTTVDTLARVFTEWDQKFLRQSRRFSTRRNTIMGGASAAAAAAAAPAAASSSLTATPSTASMMTMTSSTVSPIEPTTAVPNLPSLSLFPSDCEATSSSLETSSVPYSPATGDRMNNNGEKQGASSPSVASPSSPCEVAELSLSMATKYSSWPKRRSESRIVRQESTIGLCRSRNATATREGRAACTIL